MKPEVVRVAIQTPKALGTAAAAPHPGMALWRLGFRPFYLGAAAFAALAVPLWLSVLLAGVPLPGSVPPLLWHVHEMLFGFAAAVIVGFLFTAGKAWTGLATPRGPLLAALASLWLAARGAALFAPYAVFAAFDLLLLPIAAGLLLQILLRARNRRNLPLVGLLLLLSLANLAFHLAVLGHAELEPLRPLHATLALVVMIECVMAGRVVPAFTSAATPGLKINAQPALENASLALTAAALLCWVARAPGWLGAACFALAAAGHAWRHASWKPWLTRRRPILWILHTAYAWLWLGLALLGAAQLGGISASAGVHALGVGATGGLIIGMITRTARGHTGRTLQVGAPELAAYVLVLVAALLRVLLPLLAPQWTSAALWSAGIAWSLAFLLYLVVYLPWLTAPRLDGKDG